MIITSILDTDIYKLYMQQFVFFNHREEIVEYTFINRDKREFTAPAYASVLQEEVHEMRRLFLAKDERAYLESLGVFRKEYLDWLEKVYRFDPAHVKIDCVDHQLSVKIVGPWVYTILWETPLMATISELYNGFEENKVNFKDAAVDVLQKLNLLKTVGIFPAEFGTRRRHSKQLHEYFLINAIAVWGRGYVTTSNPYMAMKYGIECLGTMAHELFMWAGVKYGFKNANREILKQWAEFYRGKLGIALPDTYTTKVFLRDFDGYFARLYDGVRQDSGNPVDIATDFLNHYLGLGIEPKSKKIIFSDGLNYSKIFDINMELALFRDDFMKHPYAVGTDFTNDWGFKALNIVIKLSAVFDIDGVRHGTVKLGDSGQGKYTGDPADIERCKKELGIE